MGLSRSSLQNWVQKDHMESRGLPAPVDGQEHKEVAKALKRVRQLEQENEVLRRAAAYLSRHLSPPLAGSIPITDLPASPVRWPPRAPRSGWAVAVARAGAWFLQAGLL